MVFSYWPFAFKPLAPRTHRPVRPFTTAVNCSSGDFSGFRFKIQIRLCIAVLLGTWEVGSLGTSVRQTESLFCRYSLEAALRVQAVALRLHPTRASSFRFHSSCTAGSSRPHVSSHLSSWMVCSSAVSSDTEINGHGGKFGLFARRCTAHYIWVP